MKAAGSFRKLCAIIPLVSPAVLLVMFMLLVIWVWFSIGLIETQDWMRL